MISRDAEPIDHIPPRPPIEINPRKPITQDPPKTWVEAAAEVAAEAERRKRAERAWKEVNRTAGGIPPADQENEQAATADDPWGYLGYYLAPDWDPA